MYYAIVATLMCASPLLSVAIEVAVGSSRLGESLLLVRGSGFAKIAVGLVGMLGLRLPTWRLASESGLSISRRACSATTWSLVLAMCSAAGPRIENGRRSSGHTCLRVATAELVVDPRSRPRPGICASSLLAGGNGREYCERAPSTIATPFRDPVQAAEGWRTYGAEWRSVAADQRQRGAIGPGSFLAAYCQRQARVRSALMLFGKPRSLGRQAIGWHQAKRHWVVDMATLHLMVGLPCSGKTTLARTLEREHSALRLTPDEWQVRLFGQDATDPQHDARHSIIEALQWEVAESALALGTNVILDFGFWVREEREDFRSRAKRLGASSEVHFLAVPTDELLRRLACRNARPGLAFHIPEEMMRRWTEVFQRPDPDELERRR